jgi:hypothetical protein
MAQGKSAPIIHIEPIRAAYQLVIPIPHKWTVRIRYKIWFVKAAHDFALHDDLV